MVPAASRWIQPLRLPDLEQHPGLLRLAELETLRELARNANAQVY